MDFLSGVRTLFAKADIFIAGMISKVYSLILQIADVNVVNEYVKAVINRIYGIIGLFMLFKIVLVIINYIINPDKQQAAPKFVQKIIIALILIPTVPAIFDKAYELQSIILNENIIGNIILGTGVGSDNSSDLADIGDEVSYLVFSNFLDYNSTDSLNYIFNNCPNIFLEEDPTKNIVSAGNFCCHYGSCPIIPLCGYYLYYPAMQNEAYGWPDKDGNYPDSRDLYYKCKSGKDLKITTYQDWTMTCGIRDGKYIYDLINQGRESHSVSTILSEPIITAIESDPFFLYKKTGKQYCGSADSRIDSEGSFVFDYNFILATLVGLIVTFLLIVICVDIAIRAIKLAFLQVIAAVPIVSYIDINDSKLFSGWLKETISTYLQLFIRLTIVFFSILLFKWLLTSAPNDNVMVTIFIIIGILLFTLQMPKLLCELLNLKENGFFSLIKDVGKFAIGATAIGVSAVGGTIANAANTPANIANVKNSFGNASNSLQNFKANMGSASGPLGKLGVLGGTIKSLGGVPLSILKVPGSIVAGGISSSVRTGKKLVDNKGSYKKGDVTASIHESSMNRNARSSGILGLKQDDIKFELEQLKKEQEAKKNTYEQNRDYLSFKLSSENNSADIENAFAKEYSNYTEYVSEMNASGQGSHIIDQAKYDEYDELYSNQRNIDDELSQIDERIKLLSKYVKEK